MKKARILAMVVLVFGIISEAVRADFTFGDPVDVESVIPALDNTYDAIDCFSRDGLEMFIDSNRSDSYGNYDIYVLRRDSQDAQWSTAENLGPAVNSADQDAFSFISDDGLTLYFNSNRPGGEGSHDIYMTRRATRNDPWSEAQNMGSNINSAAADAEPWISPDGLEFYFASYRSGGYGASDIYVARRATPNDAWGVPVNLGPTVNSAYWDEWLSLSPDGLLLLFSDHQIAGSFRPGGYGRADMWMARRANTSKPWQSPVNLGPIVNGSAHDGAPRLSLDGRTLYFWSDRSGSWGNYRSPIIPIVDLNGDGQVDDNDAACINDRWGTDDPLCDIGPMPWGDGVVDDQDLAVLNEHMGEKCDPTLVAHWALDEAEGNTAHDSAGNCDAFVMGGPSWQPGQGQVGGAILLDGVDDCVIAALSLNPAEGPFCVFAWVKGGASGQTVVSEPMRSNWLMVDAEGRLMTQLMSASAGGGPLQSPAIITDGEWHRIGFVWDGSNRILYVDDVTVAEDAQESLPGSGNGLYIGTDGNMTPSTFWSGLIDDIRVYNRVIREFATRPEPADSAQDVAPGVTLRWTPGLKAMTHNVYFGPNSPPAFVGNQRINGYIPESLESLTTYYWRVDEIEADGATIHTGDVWTFATGAIGVQKGPYLIYPGENTQMMVLWQLDMPESHTLRWGQDGSYSEGSAVPVMYGDNQYAHTITDLAPGTKYYYEVEGVGSGSFLAAPPDDAPDVKFLVYGDTRTYAYIHNAVDAQIIATYTSDPAYQTFAMLTGDWVGKGDLESDWTTQFFSLSERSTIEMQANLPINGCIGNHERSGAIFAKYWPYPYESGGWYWSFDYGPAHIVMVDLRRTSASLGDAQKAWLEADLAGSNKEWTFLQFHAPVYTAGGNHLNNTIEQAYIQSLCEMYGVAAVFCGHNHYYARAMVNGVAHITTGGGGAPLYSPEDGHTNIVAYDASNHFCKIDIQGRQLTFEAVRLDGTIIETFTMSH
ncbi:MAG: LamG-like jellyroll fold domain-containing protein [Planctomycetota bacterium]|jgi:Tol biopolymer transport system component